MKSKPSKKTSGRRVVTVKKGPPHLVWEFKPKLQNEAAVLHSILGIYDISYYNCIINDIRGLITQLVRDHGFNQGSKRYKLIKDYTISLIEGRNPQNPEWLATSRVWNIPSKLGESFTVLIADYFRCKEVSLKPKYYQVISTILNIVRIIEGLVDADLESVTDKASNIDRELLLEFTDYVNEQLGSIGKIDKNINLFNVRFNIKKNGPNGVPKLESSIEEAIALLGSKLNNPFRILCDELNCNYLYDYISMLKNSVNNGIELKLPNRIGLNRKPNKTRETRLRVLTKIPDSGFKTRLVAIVDFWSQLILEPVRAHVQKVIELKFGKTDFRKSHDLGVTKMVEFCQRCLDREKVTLDGKTIELDVKHLKCYDISSWSDRFHRDLQKIVMRILFTPRLAEAWSQLVVHCDWYYPALGSTIKYGQGQGMGTNGSFDIATLTDHLYINFIIDRKTSYGGIFRNNECYGKVGDDLWIYDPEDKIKEFYGKINLPINLSKSKEFNGQDSIMEFCSRTFLNNTDVSRISPKIISKSKDFRYIPLLLGLCSSRGVQLDASLFQTLNNKVKGSEVTFLDNLQGWIAGMLVIGLYEHSSFWSKLTIDYLERGNWIKGDLVKRVIDDPPTLSRIVIAYSIVELLQNERKVRGLIRTSANADMETMFVTGWLQHPKINLFDIQSKQYQMFRSIVKGDLSPQQIVVFGRLADMKNLITNSTAVRDLNTMKSDKDLYKVSSDLMRISTQSSYDEGNINYSVERVISTQFKFTKILQRFDENFKVFTLPAEYTEIPITLKKLMEIGQERTELVPEILVDPIHNQDPTS